MKKSNKNKRDLITFIGSAVLALTMFGSINNTVHADPVDQNNQTTQTNTISSTDSSTNIISANANNDLTDLNTDSDNAPVKKQSKNDLLDQKRDKVVSEAAKQLGKRYILGATGPSAFDCSGLVQYAYKKGAGVNLTRTTYTQVNQGKTVSMNHLKKGDLLFFGNASQGYYHVAIYAGNNQMIHAANPRQGVIKQSISRFFYPSKAKRVLY